MKIESVHLKKFRRFTELSIRGIPPTVKLVVLVGPNGSGKSSVFDAFNFLSSVAKTQGWQYDANYHIKSGEFPAGASPVDSSVVANNIKIEFHGGDPFASGYNNPDAKKAFYFRTAYRNESDFSSNSIGQIIDALQDSRHPPRMISADTRVSDNYQRIVAETVAEIYQPGNDEATKGEIRDRLIGEVRDSMRRVFDSLILTGPGVPMQNGTFQFEKGSSKDFRYVNLSAGEKAAFDLLLDFILKTKTFDNTVYCIDEPELHMNTALQAKLLQELYRLIPERCQMWIATHSIGMMREAKRLYYEHPGLVAFLDFQDRDFDVPVELTPVKPDAAFWKKTFRVALDDLTDLVAPESIVFCEGGRTETGAKRNAEFDAKCLTKIFTSEYPDVAFVSLGGTEDVEKNAVLLKAIFQNMFDGIKISVVLDRDDRGETEVAELRARGTRVLSLRDLENYLWDNEVLSKLCSVRSQPERIAEILRAKADALAASIARGNPPDDYKSMSGDLYTKIKRTLGLTGVGNNAQAFCVNTLAPLITPNMSIYNKLKTDVFG